MITDKRKQEVIIACDELIDSPNISEQGKKEAKLTRDKMIKQLVIYGKMFYSSKPQKER